MIILLSIFLSFFIINSFSVRVKKILLPIAESRVKKFISSSINSSTKNVIFSDNLINIHKNNNQEIDFISYNTLETTKVIDKITNNIQNKFSEIENGKLENSNDYILQEIPFGVIFGNVFLRNLGPKINIKFDIIGSVLTNIETEVKSYGLNNAYIETRVYIEVVARVSVPFVSSEVKITNKIPIAISIIPGNVPDGYISSYK